jgi:catechol 2,3-dioxygenase-like lactoylglutathione lyase family enzyme
MLGDSTVFATIAVRDITTAKAFYQNTLGLKQIDEDEGGVTYASGTSKLLVYPSQYAGTNQATCASWEVADVAAAVEELQSKGVTFERYDIPGTEKEADGIILVMPGEKAAWFKDPDGNILAVGSPT